MKRVRIYAHTVGLVFRKGNFLKALTEGKHWVRWGDKVQIFDLNLPFTPPCELNILLEDKTLAELLSIVSVKDNELGIVYKEGIFKEILNLSSRTFSLFSDLSNLFCSSLISICLIAAII